MEQSPDDGEGEFCFLNPDTPIEVTYSDPACSNFELNDSAAKERRKAPGEL